jgi:alpha-galactosidase
MRKLHAVYVCALFAQAGLAADVTGRWVSEMTGPDGQTRQTVLALNQNGSELTGYMQGQGMGIGMNFQQGRISGDQISFVIMRDIGGTERPMDYTGKLVGDSIVLAMPAMGGRGPGGPPAAGAPAGGLTPVAGPPPGGGGGQGRGMPRELTFKRVSTEAQKLLPPKMQLPPPAKDVKYNGLAKTPPMGWNSWNKFARQVNDTVVREIADAMAKNGMRDAGYVYVNIDDTWEGTRDEKGVLHTNEKFPDMKALADYVHSRGLKLGIYSSPGPKTCAGFEGSYQHEAQDAKTWAEWGIDYLKYDWCSARQVYTSDSMQAAYAIMGQALLDTKRPIVYSLCQYGEQNVGEWGAKVGGNLWRTTGDIRDAWDSMVRIGFDMQPGREKFASPGHWNDPDMLEIGNGHMTPMEYRTHMSLWSLLASPLLAGNDLRDVPPEILEILTNKEVIAIDQDKLGKQAVRAAKNGDLEVWSRPLGDGGTAVGLFNRGANTAKVSARWDDIGVKGLHKVRDLWAHKDLGEMAGEFSADVPSHGVVLVKVK